MEEKDRVRVYRDRLLYAAGKLADYKNYCMILAELDENYDETLEIYKLDEWYGETDDTIVKKAAHMIEITLDLFDDMRDNAIHELDHLLKDIAEFPKNEQIEICGFEIETSILETETFSDIILEWEEPPYVQSEARYSLLNYLQLCCKP